MIGQIGASFENVVIPLVCLILPYCAYLLPLVVAVSAVVFASKISSNNELIVILSCGRSFYSIMKPLFFVSLCLFVLTLLSSLYFSPWGRLYLKSFIKNKALTKIDLQLKNGIEAGIFSYDFVGFMFYTGMVNSDLNTFYDVLMIPQKSFSSKPSNDFIMAKKAIVSGRLEDKDLTMSFYDGHFYHFSSTDKEILSSSFGQMKLNFVSLVEKKFAEHISPANKRFKELVYPEIRELIKQEERKSKGKINHRLIS